MLAERMVARLARVASSNPLPPTCHTSHAECRLSMNISHRGVGLGYTLLHDMSRYGNNVIYKFTVCLWLLWLLSSLFVFRLSFFLLLPTLCVCLKHLANRASARLMSSDYCLAWDLVEV